ncbi:MAG: L,D-transpeptidase family protein [Rhizobiaceae bacterium]
MRKTGSKFALLAAVVAATLVLSPGNADAQNLFERLFGGGNRISRRDRERTPEPPKPRRIKKISAPSYYNYKTDGLTAIKTAEIVEAARKGELLPALGAAGFAEAMAAVAGDDILAEDDIAKAVRTYYADNPDFIWVSGFSANARATEALRVLGEASSYAMDPRDYAVDVPLPGFSMDETAARLAELARFELTLSARVLRYVGDAVNGRVVADRLSGYHDLPRKAIDRVGVLKNLAHTHEVRAYLESRHPQNDQYQALRRELELLRASAENDIVIEPRTLIKPGQTNSEFPKILRLIERRADGAFRAEHGLLLTANFANQTYDAALVPVIKAAQKAHKLKPDGVIGPRTIGALAGQSRADRIEKVELALERLRWLPSELGNPYVFINQPAYRAQFVRGGKYQLSMRIVVGKVSNQTSFFYDEIEQVDFNPYWGVPQSIIVNEMLPRLVRDPGYLDRAGYEVTNGRGKRVSSSSINWGQYGGKVPFDVRQKPGASNALGELKILFPNKHDIYMHDTPSKQLFKRDTRAFSHGCVRLQDPRGMAAAVLGWSQDQIAAKLKKGHAEQAVANRIPVYVAYFTAWPDDAGDVGYSADVYGRDKRLQLAMDKTSQARQGD